MDNYLGLNLASIRYNNSTEHLEFKMQIFLIFIESKNQIMAIITMCLLIHSYLVFDIHIMSIPSFGFCQQDGNHYLTTTTVRRGYI